MPICEGRVLNKISKSNLIKVDDGEESANI